MNKLYVAYDGDNAGQHVGTSVLMDDAQALHEISRRIESGNQLVREWVESHGGMMISSGGDEGTFILESSGEEGLEELRAHYEHETGFTMTMGVGFSLSQSGKALMAGKLMGKDMMVRYNDHVEAVLEEAHGAAEAGNADEEQEKINEHYLSHLMGDEDDDMSGEGHDMIDEDEFQGDLPEMSDEDMSEEVEDEEMPEEMPEESIAMDDGAQEHDYSEMLDHMIDSPEGSDESFEDEESIELPVSEDAELDGEMESEDQEAKKDEEFSPEMAEEEMPEEGEEADLADLESALSGEIGSEDLRARIAQNLAEFKANKEVIDQLRDSNPELYQSMLGLLQSLIDLAKQLDSQDAPVEEEGAEQIDDAEDEAQAMEEAVANAAGEEEDPKMMG